jgi:hypothetical protein
LRDGDTPDSVLGWRQLATSAAGSTRITTLSSSDVDPIASNGDVSQVYSDVLVTELGVEAATRSTLQLALDRVIRRRAWFVLGIWFVSLLRHRTSLRSEATAIRAGAPRSTIRSPTGHD